MDAIAGGDCVGAVVDDDGLCLACVHDERSAAEGRGAEGKLVVMDVMDGDEEETEERRQSVLSEC